MTDSVKSWGVLASSADPAKLSLSIKSFAVLLALTGIASQDEVEVISNTLAQVVIAGGQILAGLVALYGIGRKIYLRRWS